jgi:hypothetical protein
MARLDDFRDLEVHTDPMATLQFPEYHPTSNWLNGSGGEEFIAFCKSNGAEESDFYERRERDSVQPRRFKVLTSIFRDGFVAAALEVWAEIKQSL